MEDLVAALETAQAGVSTARMALRQAQNLEAQALGAIGRRLAPAGKWNAVTTAANEGVRIELPIGDGGVVLSMGRGPLGWWGQAVCRGVGSSRQVHVNAVQDVRQVIPRVAAAMRSDIAIIGQGKHDQEMEARAIEAERALWQAALDALERAALRT